MTPSQKLRSIADSTGLDGIADAIREIANEIEHNNASAVPQGWKLVQTPITEEMHVAAVKVLHRAPGLAGLPQRMLDAMLAATPAPAPAQEVGLTEGEIQALGHRIATTYRHDEDGFRRQYAFNIYTLVDFANAIIAALRAKGGK